MNKLRSVGSYIKQSLTFIASMTSEKNGNVKDFVLCRPDNPTLIITFFHVRQKYNQVQCNKMKGHPPNKPHLFQDHLVR